MIIWIKVSLIWGLGVGGWGFGQGILAYCAAKRKHDSFQGDTFLL